MEKNTNNDPLEEYVRRSFDNYEENPAADMWTRVEGDLMPNATAEPAWGVFLRRHRLRLAAVVILLLLSGLVCEHLYYQDKMQELAQQMPKAQEKRGVAAPTIPVARTPVKADETPASGPQTLSQAPPAQPVYETRLARPEPMPSPSGAPNMGILPASTTEPSSVPHQPEQGVAHSPAHAPDDAYRVPQEGFLPAWSEDDKWSDQRVAERLATLPLPLPIPNSQFPIPNSQFPNSQFPIPNSQFPNSQFPIPNSQFPNSQFPIPNSQFPNSQFPIPNSQIHHWYIGLHATPRRTFEDVPTPARRPLMRPVFVSQQERPDVMTDWWLRVGRKTGRRFGIESGIGFSENTRTTVHAARFRFADGAAVPGSTQRRNFLYDLSTYGGSAAVELRMEPANPSAPLADAEPVVVRVWTTEHMQLLRVPMLVTYHAGAGRVQAVAKAGLVGNFFLKNDLDVTARASQNSRLRFAQGIANSIAYDRTDNFFLGYWVSAGAEFRCSRRLSIVAEPAVSGNFVRRDVQGHRLPDHRLVGVSVGVNWAVGN